MKARRFRPKLNKRFRENRNGYDVYSINAFAIRNIAQPDEEFDNFATHNEFPDLIDEGEIWISEATFAAEGEFFIANAVVRLESLEKGDSDDTAYTVGLNADRKLRANKTGITYRAHRPSRRISDKIYNRRYVVLPDEKFPIQVWLVDGLRVRSTYMTDYTEGGHGYVYDWVPKNEIWVEEGIEPAELPFIVAHEYVEHRLMRDEKMEYDPAHELCSEMEFDLRKSRERSRISWTEQATISTSRFGKVDSPGILRVCERALSARRHSSDSRNRLKGSPRRARRSVITSNVQLRAQAWAL